MQGHVTMTVMDMDMDMVLKTIEPISYLPAIDKLFSKQLKTRVWKQKTHTHIMKWVVRIRHHVLTDD